MIYVGAIPSLLHIVGLVLIGFCVGVAGAFFGVGGAFMVTPALNILGFPMIYAIGTDLAHTTGKSVVGVIRHKRCGNVDIKAAALLLIGTIPGVRLGALSVMKLESIGATENTLRIVYMCLLTVIGLCVLRESLAARGNDEPHKRSAILQKYFLLKPVVSLQKSGIKRISVWSMVALGFFTGFLASFLGVGGGFIRMPAMLYLIGMPTKIAIGTDLLEVIFSGGYGAFLYAMQERVNVIAAFIMLLGASLGSHLGVLATKYVDASKIRIYFAIMILGSAVAVGVKQCGGNTLSAVIILGLGIVMASMILYKLALGIKAAKAAKIENKQKEETFCGIDT